MANISIERYGEKWAMGLEFELWSEISGYPDVLTAEERNKLKELSDTCNGWIRMNFRTDNLEFVSLDRWVDIYENENPYE